MPSPHEGEHAASGFVPSAWSDNIGTTAGPGSLVRELLQRAVAEFDHLEAEAAALRAEVRHLRRTQCDPALPRELDMRKAVRNEDTEHLMGSRSRGIQSWDRSLGVAPVEPNVIVVQDDQIPPLFSNSQPLSQLGMAKPEDSVAQITPRSPRPDMPSSLLAEVQPAPRLLESLVPFIESPFFDCATCVVVILNAALMAVEMQCAGLRTGHDLGFTSDGHVDAWPTLEAWFAALDVCFTAFFSLELLVRILVLRGRLFRKWENWLDTAVVTIGLCSYVVPSKIINPILARLLRLPKILRAVRRITFLASFVESLSLLIAAIAKSGHILFWSVLVLIVCQSIVGMCLNQVLVPFIEDPDNDVDARQQVFALYGSFSRIMITMFEIHLANWSPACRVITNHVSEGLGMCFILYRCVAGFALLSVINSVFVQTTMRAAQLNQDVKQAQRAAELSQHAGEMLARFSEMDTSNDGLISLEELQEAAADETKRKWFYIMDLDPNDVESLFHALDADGDGMITPQELVINAGKIKGPARGIDIVNVMAQIKHIEGKIDQLGNPDSAPFARMPS